jgi:hypothetical protein
VAVARQRPKLTARVVEVPCADFYERRTAAIKLIAGALADRMIADTRAEVAARLGIDVAEIDLGRGGKRRWLDDQGEDSTLLTTLLSPGTPRRT